MVLFSQLNNRAMLIMGTRNSLTAEKEAIRLSSQPYSGVFYINTNPQFSHFTVDTQKTRLSIQAYYNGGLIWDKYNENK